MTLPVSISPKPMIELAHHRIHEGNHFLVHKISLGINIASPKYYLIIPPPSAGTNTIEMHLIFEVDTDIGGTLILFEGSTIADNGTALTIINNNRRSSSSSEVNVYEDPTVTTEGTSIYTRPGTWLHEIFPTILCDSFVPFPTTVISWILLSRPLSITCPLVCP